MQFLVSARCGFLKGVAELQHSEILLMPADNLEFHPRVGA